MTKSPLVVGRGFDALNRPLHFVSLGTVARDYWFTTMEQSDKNKCVEYRRLATYLRMAARQTHEAAFAARMFSVSDELEQKAATLSPATGARRRVATSRLATRRLI